ncbi:MAG: oligosaccharide flippase family protein [Spirochaetota bacterium]|nr:oligosaccharide flippase family protein [Spirochaetota bacterium]
MTTKSKIFKDTLIVNSASLVEKVLFFFLNILIARYLTVEHFGEYSTALSYATFFSLMTDIGINVTLIRALNLEKEYENEHFTNAFYLKLSLSVTMYIVMAISLLLTGYNRDVINLTLILGLVRIGNEFMKTYYALYEAKQQFLFPSVVNSLYVVFFFLGVIAVILFQGNYYHLCLVRLVVVYLFIALLTVHIFKKVKFRLKTPLFITFIKSAIPFSTIAVLTNLTFKINAVIISLMIGTTQVGFFSNSILFVDTLAIIPDNLKKILMPGLYSALEKKDVSKFQFSFDILSKYFGIVSFYLMLVLFLYAETIITTVFGNKYFNSAILLQIIAFSLPFVFNVASIILVGKDRQSVLSRIMLVSTIVNIAANIILIKILNIKGAAVAVTITYANVFFMSHYYLRKLESIKMVPAFKKYVIIGAIVFVTCLLYEFLNVKQVSLYVSFLLISLMYGLLTVGCIMNKDDIRIIQEMLGVKK